MADNPAGDDNKVNPEKTNTATQAPDATPTETKTATEESAQPLTEKVELKHILNYLTNAFHLLDTRTNAGIDLYKQEESNYLERFVKEKIEPLKKQLKDHLDGKTQEESAEEGKTSEESAEKDKKQSGGAVNDPKVEARFIQIEEEIRKIKEQLALLQNERGALVETFAENLKRRIKELEEEREVLKNGYTLNIFGDIYSNAL
jgi:hypothetical protein